MGGLQAEHPRVASVRSPLFSVALCLGVTDSSERDCCLK